MEISAKDVVRRFRARKVAATFMLRLSMSAQDAKKILGLPLTGTPTDDEIRKAQRIKVVEYGHDRGGDQAKIVEVNQAAQLLLEGVGSGSSNQVVYEPPPEEVTTFAEAKSKVTLPTDVKWLFKTVPHYSGYSTDESSNSATGYVAVGKDDDTWFFVTVEYHHRQDYFVGGARPTSKVYNITVTKLPMGKPTPQSVYSAVVKAWDNFERLDKAFNSKILVLPSDWTFKDFEKKHLQEGHPTTIKNFLVDSGLVDKGSVVPGKVEVKVLYKDSLTQKPGYYQAGLGPIKSDWQSLVLIINGREHALSEENMKLLARYRVGGKSFIKRVFGDYAYNNTTKVLSRIRDAKEILGWMAGNLKLDSDIAELLKAASGAP